MRRPNKRTELEPMLPVGKRTRMRPTVGREVAMLKFGLLTLIDPLLRNLERAHPTLPGEPHLGANRTYSTWLLVRLWMVRVLAGWSQRQLFAKLQRRRVRAWLRRFIDLPRRLPSRSHYGRRVRQPDFLAALPPDPGLPLHCCRPHAVSPADDHRAEGDQLKDVLRVGDVPWRGGRRAARGRPTDPLQRCCPQERSGP